jgi:hypothetical protein
LVFFFFFFFFFFFALAVRFLAAALDADASLADAA